MTTMPDNLQTDKFQALRTTFEELVNYISAGVENREAMHKVEQGLWTRILKMGWEAMNAFIFLSGHGDEGASLCMPDGRKLKRLEFLHSRPYLSVFGEFKLTRWVYGTREGQKIEHVPLDNQLQLPQSKFSYMLQGWNQLIAVEMPFAKVSSVLEKILGFRQSVNSLERTNRNCAEEVEGFWEERPVPSSEKEGNILVCSADGKGVPMRRNDIEKQSAVSKPASGMRPGDKKMALVGSVYSVDDYPRTPEQIVDALFRSGEAPSHETGRPKPCFKHVRAALMRDQKNTTTPQVKEIFEWMANEVEQRGQEGKRPLVL